MVNELRGVLLDQTVGNDFGLFCICNRQAEGHTVATQMVLLQPALKYFSKELHCNMGRKALYETFSSEIQQDMMDAHLNLKQLPEVSELVVRAKETEQRLEQCASVMQHTREIDRSNNLRVR